MEGAQAGTSDGGSLSGVKVVVVGAGISGLAAAHALEGEGAQVEVVEAGTTAGGRIATIRRDGYLVECGPNALRAGDPGVSWLLERSGVQTVEAPARAARYVVHGGRPVEVPLHPVKLLRSPLLTWGAKVRLLAEPFVPPAPEGREESVEGFMVRRFGRGVAPLVDAMVTGVHAGDPRRLSARRVLGPVVAWERAGGVLRGARRFAREGGRGAWVAPAQGMQEWVQALADPLAIRYGERVEQVIVEEDGIQVRTDRGRLDAERVVVATETETAARVLGSSLSSPPTAPVTVVAFGLAREDLLVDGYGVLCPGRERRFILGVLLESCLFPGRAPAGRAVVRCFVGGRRDPERAGLSERELVERAWADLVDLGVVRGDPDQSMVFRTRGIPQMELGHEDRVRALAKGPAADPRVQVVGMGNQAVGVSALVKEALEVPGAFLR